MNRRIAAVLFTYAALMLLPGLFSVFYNSEHLVGWTPHGKTGLIACGTGAVLAAIFGFCSQRGRSWALWAGLALSFLFVAQCGSSSFKAVRAMSDSDPKAWFKLAVNSAAFLVSLRTFVTLGLIARQQPQS